MQLLIHEDDRERVRVATVAALAGEAPMDLDMRIRRRDGEIRILHCRAAATIGPDGSARRLDGTCVDVTDRRRAERRLAEAQRFAQLGSWDLDVGRDEITWSREMYRIFGEDPEHFVPTSDAAHRARRRGGPRAAHRAHHGRARARRRLRLVRPHPAPRRGDPRRPLPRHDGAGDRRAGEGHLHGICQDLTDVRRAEGARTEAVERFRSVFERAPIGMALLARDGRFTLANEAMAEFLGRPGGELLDCRVGDVTHPDDMPATSEALRRMVAGELAEWNAEKRYVRPSGEVRWGAAAGAAPARRGRPHPALPGAPARRHRPAAGPSGGAPRSTASRGSWPAARR